MISGCEIIDQTNACISDNPLEEVIWLKEMRDTLTDCICELSIIQGTYDNQTVFFIASTDPLCDGIDTPTLYDCHGNLLITFNMDNYQEFYQNVTRDKVLYRCDKQE